MPNVLHKALLSQARPSSRLRNCRQLPAWLQYRPQRIRCQQFSAHASPPLHIPPSAKVACFISNITDPFSNLAIEEYLFRHVPTTHILFLYRNTPSVIIGRNQNPWKETQPQLLEQNGVPLVRRRSGGGTVYHDLGNTCYSIMMPRDQFVRRTNAELICRALHQLDIPAHVNERNDILIHDDKVSGSAYKLVNARAYHHGTMLIDSDLHALGQYLRAPAKNLVSKGVESVRSSVTRLREYSFTVDHMSFCEAAVHEFCRFHGHKSSGSLSADMDSAVVRYITNDTASSIPEIRTYEEELRSWEWIYGQTPDFTHRLNWTGDASSTSALDIVIKMHRGIITEASVDINGGSTLSESHVALALRLSECLKGKRYGADGVDEAFDQIQSHGITGVNDVRNWLRNSL